MHFDRAALLRAREDANLTQEQLAAKAGSVASTISRLERGEGGEPTLATIYKLANALDIGIDELLVIDTGTAA